MRIETSGREKTTIAVIILLVLGVAGGYYYGERNYEKGYAEGMQSGASQIVMKQYEDFQTKGFSVFVITDGNKTDVVPIRRLTQQEVEYLKQQAQQQ